MIEETVAQIERRLAQAKAMDPERRKELQELLASLKAEIAELAKSHPEHASNITGHMDASTREATRPEPHSASVKRAVDDLSSSVTGFEAAHPRLVSGVNRICVVLSNMGI